MAKVNVRFILGDEHLDLGMADTAVPSVGDTIEFSGQPSWPEGEQRGFKVASRAHVIDRTTGRHALHVTLAEDTNT